MKQTIPYQFPYPQCDPPLTKDAADIAQFRDLAIAIDTRIHTEIIEANDLVNSPDAAVLVNTGTQVLSTPTDQLLMTTVEYDTTPGGVMADEANSQFLIRQTGVYLMTCSLRVTFAGTFTTQVNVDINGLVWGPHGVSKGNATDEAGLGFSTVRPLSAGDIVLFRWAGTPVAASVQSARGGIWRLM